MDKKYQIILYGATGFTGRLCAEYFQANYPDLNWAISGRNPKTGESYKISDRNVVSFKASKKLRESL